MIDFTTLQGLTIPEGVVTQITDASGNVIWAVQSESGEPIVLEVEKITSDTYAGGTTYTGESFILLDIYPKNASSKVKVTYGGLTKTLTFSGTNAQQAYFGTFNGVTDEVETPASGTLTIEGGCSGVGTASYMKAKTLNAVSNPCITAITQWGGITYIPANAFYSCDLHIDKIPEGIVSIGAQAFWGNQNLNRASITLPSTLQGLYLSAFAFDLTVSGDTKTSYGLRPDIITMLSSTPPTLTFDADYIDADNTQFIVPKGCGEAYKTAEGWSNYVDKIVEAS